MRIVIATALFFIASVNSTGAAKPAGYDISYPNCMVVPPRSANVVVLGINGGKVFTPNPCFGRQYNYQLGLVRPWSLQGYVNTAYPGAESAQRYRHSPRACPDTDHGCLAYNYGWEAGKYATEVVSANHARFDTWWLDVETLNSWTPDTGQNVQSLAGTMEAIRHYAAPRQIGFYSTPFQWQQITGGWRPPAPNWVATGEDLATAIEYCVGKDFTGHGTAMTQYIEGIDYNYACPN
jgi:hypothetical protein